VNIQMPDFSVFRFRLAVFSVPRITEQNKGKIEAKASTLEGKHRQ
jgi:hypothetical protein